MQRIPATKTETENAGVVLCCMQTRSHMYIVFTDHLSSCLSKNQSQQSLQQLLHISIPQANERLSRLADHNQPFNGV